MTSVLEWIEDIAPEIFSNNSIDKQNRFISIAKSEIERNLFSNNDTYNLGVAYYVCHLLELSLRDSNSRGILTQEKEGDLSRSYGGGNNPNLNMNTTQYLDSYNRLLKSRIASFYISNGVKANGNIY